MLKGLQSLDYPQIKVCKDRPSYYGSIQGGSAEVSSAEVGPLEVSFAEIGFALQPHLFEGMLA